MWGHRLAPLLLVPAMAMAQPVPEHPFVVPQRDVDVLYAVPIPAGSGSSTMLSQRRRFAIDPERQRIDPPGNGTYMITDYAARRTLVVQPLEHLATVLPMPGDAPAPHGMRTTAIYHRLAPEQVAGVGCTDWNTQDSYGRVSTICLTDDGVMLRATQQGRVLVEALRVQYEPQDPSVFAVPPGYRMQAAAYPP